MGYHRKGIRGCLSATGVLWTGVRVKWSERGGLHPRGPRGRYCENVSAERGHARSAENSVGHPAQLGGECTPLAETRFVVSSRCIAHTYMAGLLPKEASYAELKRHFVAVTERRQAGLNENCRCTMLWQTSETSRTYLSQTKHEPSTKRPTAALAATLKKTQGSDGRR